MGYPPTVKWTERWWTIKFFCILQIYNYRPGFGPVLSCLDSSHLKHDSTRSAAISIMIIIVEIHNFSNARLDDDLGTIVARKKCDINGSTSHIRRTLIQDGIDLRVGHVAILFVEFWFGLPRPRQTFVRTSSTASENEKDNTWEGENIRHNLVWHHHNIRASDCS